MLKYIYKGKQKMIRKNLHTYMESLQEKDSMLYKYREQRKSFIAQHLQADAVLEDIEKEIVKALQKELERR